MSNNPKNIVRITADNPLMDAKLIDELISHYEKSKCNYAVYQKAIYGLSSEVFSFEALSDAYKNADNCYDQEHVTPYIKNNCIVNNITIDSKYQNNNLSITIDTLEDYVKMQNLYLYFEENSMDLNINSLLDYYRVK